jgi:hypothetical protein
MHNLLDACHKFRINVFFLLSQLYPQLSTISLEPFNCQPEGLGLLAAGSLMQAVSQCRALIFDLFFFQMLGCLVPLRRRSQDYGQLRALSCSLSASQFSLFL